MKNSTTSHFSLSQLHCASCVAKIEKTLLETPGIESATVNFAQQTLTVSGTFDIETLLKLLEGIGYPAQLIETGRTQTKDFLKQDLNALKQQTLLAFLVGVPLWGLMLFYPPLEKFQSPYNQFFGLSLAMLTLLTMAASGHHIYHSAFQAFKHRQVNMHTLIALGTSAAWIYSAGVVIFLNRLPHLAQHLYFEAALLIIAFVNLGAYLELKARGKTSQAIAHLLDLTPKKATLVEGDVETVIPLDKVHAGQTLRIKPGEKIPVDGLITQGETYVNEAMLTGEPLPQHKKVGDLLIAGTVNGQGSVLMTAQAVGETTVLANIVRLVEQAQNSKPPIGRLADRIAGIFVPIVLLIAALTALVWLFLGPYPPIVYALITSLSVLIIACPCALGLATPIAIMIGMGRAAKAGILIRNGDALQTTAAIDTLLLDKTGTLTEGRPVVTEIIPQPGVEPSQLLQVAYSLEKNSEHPLAQAICYAAKEKQIDPLPTTDFQAHVGQGVSAHVAGQIARLGNYAWLRETGIEIPVQPHKTAASLVYVAYDKTFYGTLYLTDKVRDDAGDAIAQLALRDIYTIMLTGDHQDTAEAVAQQVGITEVYADLRPQDKLNQIRQLQNKGQKVAMVGDGINDAPALAAADVGIAIGSGTDVAIESADITLLSHQLNRLPQAVTLSQRVLGNIKQNLFFAFAYNLIALPLAAGVLYPHFRVLLNPIVASIAMTLSSLTVVTNANRLRRG